MIQLRLLNRKFYIFKIFDNNKPKNFITFQPCDKEMLIMLHFVLKHPIMIGKFA